MDMVSVRAELEVDMEKHFIREIDVLRKAIATIATGGYPEFICSGEMMEIAENAITEINGNIVYKAGRPADVIFDNAIPLTFRQKACAAAHKVLHEGGNSKKDKMRAGKDLTQRIEG